MDDNARGAAGASLVVERADPTGEDALRLVQMSEDELAPHYPPEDRFAYSPEKLVARGVFFVMARNGGGAVGCGGLEACDGYGELKRMYVTPEARGSGAAAAILSALEAEASRLALPLLRLETGIHQHAAMAFYRRHGFGVCGRFGDYPVNGTSVYMEKRLAP